MSKICIFVSHRIDIVSELIDNPLYVPMRCGAVFDDKNPMGILGDDTGDNISERRMSFCEFTVQYWAWKNCDADYYGLCHYRRYLSFAEKRYKTDEYNMVYKAGLLPRCKKQFGLLNVEEMRRIIEKYDLVVSEYADVHNIPTPTGKKQTVWELWEAQDGYFFQKQSSLELVLDLIDRMAPEYSRSAREYFTGSRHRGFNCYVMRRALFDRLCRFQFPIMLEIERRLDMTGYTQTMLRTPAYIGEILYGVFVYHITVHEQWKVHEVQLVYFSNTERIRGKGDLIKRILWFWFDKGLRTIADPIFPKGSQRREKIKDIFYRITPAKRRGPANIKQKNS